MASSRLEKIGTIYTRINGLLKTGAMKWPDRPLWYDVYEAFPPIDEPRYDRPVSDKLVKPIFYDEDVIRARFHKENNTGTINLSYNESKTRTKRFLENYHKLEASTSVDKDNLYEEALHMLLKDAEEIKQQRENNETASLVETFKTAQKKQQTTKIDISEVMKEK